MRNTQKGTNKMADDAMHFYHKKLISLKRGYFSMLVKKLMENASLIFFWRLFDNLRPK